MWIAVFKTGRHTDSNGNERQWTEADLDRIAAAYDPKEHEAPVVIGHPKDNAPAYGWVGRLKRTGGVLFADIKPTVAEFTNWLRAGLFKKRSMSLYPDMSLRHIGFLGAMPPAVKGLPDFVFNGFGAAYIEFEGEALPVELEEDPPASPCKLEIKRGTKGGRMNFNFWEELKAFLKGKGVDVGEPGAFTEDQGIATAAAVARAKAELENSFAEKETALKAKEAELAARAAEARKKEVADFCESLKKQGVLTPAMEKLGMGITAFIQAISAIETTYEFSEPDGNGGRNVGEGLKPARQTPYEFMRSFLSGLPKAIEFREVAASRDDPGGGGFAERRERAITEFMEREKADYRTAFLAVSKERPELFELERR